MAKLIVTGGAGFIGSHLVDLLLGEGHRVLVIDNFSTGRPQNLARHKKNRRLKIIRADVNNRSTIEKHFRGAEAVFHLAALADIVPSIERPEDYFRANVDGTFSALEAARKCGVKKFVYAASSSCYGLPDVFPTPETAEIKPQYPYALTKWLGEQTVLHWGKVYKLPVVSLRLFNVYGPRSRTSGTYGAVFGVFLAQKLRGRPFTVVGDGSQKRDFIFVTDVAAAFYSAYKSAASGEIFNVGCGKAHSVNELAGLLGGQRVHIPKRPGEPDVTLADTRRIRRVLGWKPGVSFEEGVAAVLREIDYWRSAPLWTPAAIKKATGKWFEHLGPKGPVRA